MPDRNFGQPYRTKAVLRCRLHVLTAPWSKVSLLRTSVLWLHRSRESHAVVTLESVAFYLSPRSLFAAQAERSAIITRPGSVLYAPCTVLSANKLPSLLILPRMFIPDFLVLPGKVHASTTTHTVIFQDLSQDLQLRVLTSRITQFQLLTCLRQSAHQSLSLRLQSLQHLIAEVQMGATTQRPRKQSLC